MKLQSYLKEYLRYMMRLQGVSNFDLLKNPKSWPFEKEVITQLRDALPAGQFMCVQVGPASTITGMAVRPRVAESKPLFNVIQHNDTWGMDRSVWRRDGLNDWTVIATDGGEQ